MIAYFVDRAVAAAVSVDAPAAPEPNGTALELGETIMTTRATALHHAQQQYGPHVLLVQFPDGLVWTTSALLCLRAAILTGNTAAVAQLLRVGSFVEAHLLHSRAPGSTPTPKLTSSRYPSDMYGGKASSSSPAYFPMLAITAVCEEALGTLAFSEGAKWLQCRCVMSRLGYSPPTLDTHLAMLDKLVGRMR